MPTIFATALDVMDILHLFYATNIVAVLISVVLALFIIWVAIHFRRNPLSLCCRIFPFSMLLLGAYKLSTCFIVSGQGIEVLPTQALGLCAASYLNITQWGAADIDADLKQVGKAGSPTNVKAVQNIVFKAKESQTLTSSDADVENLMVELLNNKIIG